MSEEKILIFTKPNCEKCVIAKELGKKLKEQGKSVKFLSIDTVDGLTEFTYHGFQYPPAVVAGDKKYSSIKQAERELLK